LPLVFYPSGKVTPTVGGGTLTLSLPTTSLTETITVSNYGSVNVTP
jgi:hypothetical protein